MQNDNISKWLELANIGILTSLPIKSIYKVLNCYPMTKASLKSFNRFISLSVK